MSGGNADTCRELMREYRITPFQMQHFYARLCAEPEITVHGNSEQGQIEIPFPMCGRVLLGYRLETCGGVTELEVSLIAAPPKLPRPWIWQQIDKILDQVQKHGVEESCPGVTPCPAS